MLDQLSNPSAEWKYERFVTNPSIPEVVVLVAIAIAIFIAISWTVDATLAPGLARWIHPIVALFIAVTLIQGLPTKLRDEVANTLPFSTRLKFYCPLWTSRIALLVVLFETYFRFIEMESVARWLFLGVMSLVIVPAMWFALLQIRQFGLLLVMRGLPASHLPVATIIPLSQVALWGTTAHVWFTEYSVWIAVAVTLLTWVWHGVGNVILAALLRSHMKWPRQSGTGTHF